MTHPVSSDRRRFLTHVALGAAALPLLCLSTAQADLPHQTPDDPNAKALNYTDDSSKIAPAAAASYKAGSHCANCALFTAPASGDWGACGAFSGKAVNKNGWCMAYAAKS
jgi:hypothetical protein